jgi:outer membrane lipase/esterase
MIAAALAAVTLPAQAQFTSLTGFGDSYADTGAAPGGAFRIIGTVLNVPGFYPCPSPLYSCRFTGSTNFVDSLQSIYGLPGLTNYSIGGARTDNTNTMPYLTKSYGFPYEPQQFSGTHFTNRDLIALSIGGNDLSEIVPSGSNAQQTTQIETAAANSARNAAAGVGQLVAAGARNIAWLSTGSSKWFPEPPGGITFSSPQRDAWADVYYQQTQQLLAPLARSGVRIFLFDFGILQERVNANPGLYGFTNAYNCEAGPPNTVSPPYTPSSVQTNFAGCFYENSVHPPALQWR